MDHAHHHHEIDEATTKVPVPTFTRETDAIVDVATAHAPHLVHIHQQDHSQGPGHQMQMFFHWGCNEIILFSFWQINSFYGLLISFIFIFLMGTLYEGIKWFRVYFQLWILDSAKSSGCTGISMNSVSNKEKHQGIEDALIEKTAANTTSGCCGESTGNTLASQEVYAPTVVITPAGTGMPINRWTWVMMYIGREFSPATCSMIETSIYAVQLVLAYWLMLIAMSFNIWLTAAVVLGAAFGHWLFANIKCAPPRRCFCTACCSGNGGPEHAENFSADACH